ncbi:MAG: metallophosphoesterase [Chloroflexi bacterium]|nr:metallophosphoesterase [Chloroflexota bacterium]
MGIGGLTYMSRIEPVWFETVHVPLRLSRLAPAFSGFRLVQLSDIHLSSAMTGERLSEVVRSVLALSPDLVAITGDFVDNRRRLQQSLDDITQALRPLVEATQVVAVLGNHDYWTGPGSVRQMLAGLGVLELPNQVLALEREGKSLYIAGVDDVIERHARLKSVLEQIPETGGAAVLLAHEPDFADQAAGARRFDLQISGHSHGGQVVLPGIGPPILPRMGEKYPLGLYTLEGMFQYTNRGLGTIPPRVRFNCRPEITVFTLEPEE